MVIVSFSITLRQDVKDELVTLFEKAIKDCSQSCTRSSFSIDVSDPAMMHLYEEWESVEALKTYMNSPAFHAFHKARKKLGEGTVTIHSGGRYEATPLDPAVLE